MFQIVDIVDRYVHRKHQTVLLGRTADGSPRTVVVHDVPHTISVAIGPRFYGLADVAAELNYRLSTKALKCRKFGCRCGGGKFGVFREDCPQETGPVTWEPVLKVEVVKGRGSDMYEAGTRSFATFTLTHPYFFAEAEKFLAEKDFGVTDPALAGVYNSSSRGVDSFMITRGVRGFDWVALPDDVHQVSYSKLQLVEKPPVLPAQLTNFFFDIETLAKKYVNSESAQAKYPVFSISAFVTRPGVPMEKHTLFLRSDQAASEQKPRPGLRIFDTEVELLQAFKDLWMETDAPVITTFNGNAFDIPYLLKRAALLGMARFDELTAIPGMKVLYSSRVKETSAKGEQEIFVVDCPGRICLDLYRVAKDTLNLNGNSLNDVADNYNIPAKIGIKYTHFWEYFHRDGDSRAELVEYNEWDVGIMVEVVKKSNLVSKMISKSQIIGVLGRDTLERGVGYQLFMMVRRVMKREGFLMSRKYGNKLHAAHAGMVGVPAMFQGWTPESPLPAEIEYASLHADALRGDKYPGAKVFDPVTGLHMEPIMTVDYKSLYPSLIISFNICTTTVLRRPDDLPADQVNISPPGFGYVKKEVRMGIIPQIEIDLLASRAKIRKEQKEHEEGSEIWLMLDVFQTETKVVANALYGQFGAITSALCNLANAYSITAYGVHYIERTCDGVLSNPDFEQYGLSRDYGDTDSLMFRIRYPGDCREDDGTEQRMPTRSEAYKIGKIVQHWINKEAGILQGTMEMEFENVSQPTLMLAKKRYIKCLESGGKLKLKKSGLGKRGSTPFLTQLQDTIFRMGMIEQRPYGEIERGIKDQFTKLLSGEVPDEDLMHSTNLSKPVHEYDTETPHIRAAKQLIQAGVDVKVNDRIQFYFCDFGGGKKKAGNAVAAELLDGRQLDYQMYEEETQKALLKTVLAFVGEPGDSEYVKRARLASLSRDTVRLEPASYSKIDTAAGAMDMFVSRNKRVAEDGAVRKRRITGSRQAQTSIRNFFAP